MINLLCVGAGGFVGSILRYMIGQICKNIIPNASFPIGTFLANIIGAFLIGVALQFFTKNSTMGTSLQLFIMTGVMGGFTTFSTFSMESINLIEAGRIGLATMYIFASLLICLLGVWIGKSI